MYNELHRVITMCFYQLPANKLLGATVGSEQEHNQDLREIYKVGQILKFITFLPQLHCI